MASHLRGTGHLLVFGALALIVSAGIARASTVTVFSNFGPNQSYDFGAGQWLVAGIDYGASHFGLAMSFTAGSTVDLGDAVLPLLNCCPSNPNAPVSLYLESNSSSNVPGSILATLTQQGSIPVYPASPTGGLVTFDYTGAPVELTAGTQYWLVAFQSTSTTEDLWPFSFSNTGRVDQSYTGYTGPWQTASGPQAAFQVDGTIPLATAAEPGSLVLLLVALGGLVFYEYRRRVVAG